MMNGARIRRYWNGIGLLPMRISAQSHDPNEGNFLHTIVANYILEGIYFYSGFSFFYTLARQGKMTATSTIFKYINRDEVTHLILFQNILRELRHERPDLFTKEQDAHIADMIRQGAENEIKWGQYITDDKILGLNNGLIEKYISIWPISALKPLDLRPFTRKSVRIPWNGLKASPISMERKRTFLKRK